MNVTAKYIILFISLLVTILMCLWPNFHPEQKVLNQYYWFADILIHGGYYYLLALLLFNLKLKVKPLYLALALTLLSFVLESLQHFSFKRGVSLMDAASNLGGITLALLTYILLQKIVVRKK